MSRRQYLLILLKRALLAEKKAHQTVLRIQQRLKAK